MKGSKNMYTFMTGLQRHWGRVELEKNMAKRFFYLEWMEKDESERVEDREFHSFALYLNKLTSSRNVSFYDVCDADGINTANLGQQR